MDFIQDIPQILFSTTTVTAHNVFTYYLLFFYLLSVLSRSQHVRKLKIFYSTILLTASRTFIFHMTSVTVIVDSGIHLCSFPPEYF